MTAKTLESAVELHSFAVFCKIYCHIKDIKNAHITRSHIANAQRAKFGIDKPVLQGKISRTTYETYDYVTEHNRDKLVKDLMRPDFVSASVRDDCFEISFSYEETEEEFSQRKAEFEQNLMNWEAAKAKWEAEKISHVAKLEAMLQAQTNRYQDPEYIQFLKLQAKLKDRGMLE